MTTTIKTRTPKGTEVEIEPCGHAYCGGPIAELNLHFDHPQHGRSFAVVRRYQDHKDATGAVGHAFLGPKRKYLDSICVAIPRDDFERGMQAAQVQAEAAVEAERRADEERDEAARIAARAACPTGYVPCRRVWANGDLCSALYRTEDGIEVLGSDLLESHGGWYWIKEAKVEAERSRKAEEAARIEAKRVEEESRRAAALMTAQTTREKVEIARWTEECDDPREECDLDLCVSYILPDGSTATTRTHTH